MKKAIIYIFLLGILLVLTGCSEEDNSNVLIVSNPAQNSLYTGWVDYVDTQYNSTNLFTIAGGSQVKFPNNAGNIRETQKPIDIITFYNGTHILGKNGDAYGIAIRFKANPNAANIYCEFFYNISGSVGQLPARMLTFPKGGSVVQNIKFYGAEYTLDTWEQNGAVVETFCSGQVSFYDITYEIFRLHKAR